MLAYMLLISVSSYACRNVWGPWIRWYISRKAMVSGAAFSNLNWSTEAHLASPGSMLRVK